MQSTDLGLSVFIIITFVFVLCIYVYYEYYKPKVTEEFVVEEEELVVEEFEDNTGEFKDIGFFDFFKQNDDNWKKMKKDLEGMKKDILSLKGIVFKMDTTTDSTSDLSVSDLNKSIARIGGEVERIQNRMNSIDTTIGEMRANINKVGALERDLRSLRETITQMDNNNNNTPPSDISTNEFVTLTQFENMRASMTDRLDTRKAEVDAYMQDIGDLNERMNKRKTDVDAAFEDVARARNARFEEYDSRLSRHVEEIEGRLNSMNQTTNGAINQTNLAWEDMMENVEAQVDKNKKAIDDLKNHNHEQYALVGEVDDMINDSVEKYLTDRTFSTFDLTNEEMRKQIDQIITEHQGSNSDANMNSSNFMTRAEFQNFAQTQQGIDNNQNRRISGLNTNYEMKDLVTRGELDERLNLYVTKLSFAPFLEETILPVNPPKFNDEDDIVTIQPINPPKFNDEDDIVTIQPINPPKFNDEDNNNPGNGFDQSLPIDNPEEVPKDLNFNVTFR